MHFRGAYMWYARYKQDHLFALQYLAYMCAPAFYVA